MRIVLVICIALIVSSCEPVDTNPPSITAQTSETATPWTSLSPKDSDENFHFVVVTDRTGGHRPGVFSGALPKVNLLAPAFVVSVGDLIEGYTENQVRIDQEWDEMEGFISQLEAPFFYAAGNHDMNNAVMAESWLRRFGPSFYQFEYKDVLFLVLNSELFGMVSDPEVSLPGPWTLEQQMQFIETVLANNKDARWTVVLIHQPLWNKEKIHPDWLRVEQLLGERNYTVFAGHEHRYSKNRRHNRNYITLATTGGGSALRGPIFGEFDHVAWVSMTENGPRIANLELDGIHDEDVSNVPLQTQAKSLAASVSSVSQINKGLMFSNATQTIRIKNPTNVDMLATPVISRPGNFHIEGLHQVNVPAGESVDLTLALSSKSPIAYKKLNGAGIEWTLATQIEKRPVQVQTTTAVLPLTKFPIPKVSKAPAIDGDLSDWTELPYIVDHQGDMVSPITSAEDISFSFGVTQDSTALYIAVDVVDDMVFSDPGRRARDQDSIVIGIDTRPDPARNLSMGIGKALFGGHLAKMTLTMLTVGPTAEDKLLGFMAETDQLVTSKTVKTETGYRTELAVPIDLLNKKAGGVEWNDVRIGIRVKDFDEGGEGSEMLHWQPYRYGNAPLSGTHAFIRN